jgi:hypothetical protein
MLLMAFSPHHSRYRERFTATKDVKSLDTFWLFERNEKFEQLFREYKERIYGEIVDGKENDNRTIQGKNENN